MRSDQRTKSFCQKLKLGLGAIGSRRLNLWILAQFPLETKLLRFLGRLKRLSSRQLKAVNPAGARGNQSA